MKLRSHRMNPARRCFIAGAAAGAAATALLPLPARPGPAQRAQRAAQPSGYRVTAHVRRYYEKANL